MSTSTEYMDGLNAPAERRFYPRVTPPTPIYVAFGSNNLGVLYNVSENGFQVSTPEELPLNSVFRVSLSLNGASKTIGVTVRTIWTDSADKRSGIQLLDLSDEDRQQIRKWVVFEMSRNENPNAWFLPRNGERRSAERSAVDRPTVSEVAPVPPAATVSVPAPEVPTDGASVSNAAIPEPRVAEAPRQGSQAPQTPRVKLPSAWVPPPAAGPVRVTPAEPPAPQARPAASQSAPAPSAASQPAADLPPLANPFDDPGPSSQFQQFPSVPLPIHGEFEYAKPAPSRRRRASTWSSQLRTKPLILWAVALALICFGANALVRYRIKENARRFAVESARSAPAKSDGAASDPANPADDSNANAATSPATDSQPVAGASPDTKSSNQAPAPQTSSDAAAANTAQNSSPAATAPSAEKSAPRRESSLDARANGAYSATAPPTSGSTDESTTARSTAPGATPRTWSAPAPNRTSTSPATTSAAASEAPQTPNVTSASNENSAQPAPAPVVSETRPTPPVAPVVQQQPVSNAANSSTTSSASASSSSSNAANSTQARMQPPGNTQSSSYASNTNTNTPPARQSPIYNANAPIQRSAIIASINSVHSSGIFDSNDATSAAAPAASRGGNASANVTSRPVSSTSVVPSDTPQEHDLEIAAPKGFTASWVDVPGERVVRTTAGTVHIRRLVRVPGERIPGQRWLWRGKLNVTLGDVVNRIDPSVAQASGASGSLTVMATIDKDGYVTDLKPLYGNFAMLPSVSRAVRNWHCDPTYVDNKRSETQAQIEFDLNPAAASNRSTRP